MNADFFFKPRLNRNIDEMIDNLIDATRDLYRESNGIVDNGCIGLRIINSKAVLCREETVSKYHCSLHSDISARINILYHSIDPNFQKLLDIVDSKVKKTSSWSKELIHFSGLLTSDKNYVVPNEDIQLVLSDWNFIFDLIDDVEMTDYLETIDDVVYAFLVAELVYKLRCLSQILLYSEIGIDPGHLRYLILTLHMRNKIARIIGQSNLELNLFFNVQSINELIRSIASIKEACIYLYSTLEMFTTLNKLRIDNRYNPFLLINSDNLIRRDKILLPIVRYVSTNYIEIYSTQEPRNNCVNVNSINTINRILADSSINVQESEFLRKLCNAVVYENLYNLFNCLILRINTVTKKDIALLTRILVLPRPRLIPKLLVSQDYYLVPKSNLAKRDSIRTTTRLENETRSLKRK